MRVHDIKKSLLSLTVLFAMLCTGCDSAGVYDIVLGSLRLAEGIVGVAT